MGHLLAGFAGIAVMIGLAYARPDAGRARHAQGRVLSR
jgi:hypothetical protein